LFWASAGAVAKQVEKGPHRHFDLEAGDASLMLNEFSRQSDLQVLFDFNILRGMKTRAVVGDLDAADALRSMLKGTGLVFDFVNDRTLAVTPKKPSLVSRLWHRLKTRAKHASGDDGLDQVLISGRYGDHLDPPPGAPVTQFDRTEIDRAGVATVPDLLRTIPQIWGGGPAEGNIRGYEQGTNTGFGNGTNFRGLGAGSTIALLNGREIAPSGNSAAFSDISNIPLSAIDHVEIVPEGGSIPYGPQAVGGIINFVMRDRFDGAEAQARFGSATGGALREHQASLLLGNHIGEATGVVAFEYYRRGSLPASDRAQATSDLTPLGGSNFDTVFGNPGTITDGTQTWAIPKHQDGVSLSAMQLVAGTQNLHDQFEGATILPQQQRLNFYANGSVPISDDVQLSIDALFADRRFVMSHSGFQLPLIVPNTNPFYVNPAGGNDPVEVD
jgi:iron complex outermembrane receptor protein